MKMFCVSKEKVEKKVKNECIFLFVNLRWWIDWSFIFKIIFHSNVKFWFSQVKSSWLIDLLSKILDNAKWDNFFANDLVVRTFLTLYYFFKIRTAWTKIPMLLFSSSKKWIDPNIFSRSKRPEICLQKDWNLKDQNIQRQLPIRKCEVHVSENCWNKLREYQEEWRRSHVCCAHQINL